MKFFERLFGGKRTATDSIEEPPSRNVMSIDSRSDSNSGSGEGIKVEKAPEGWKTATMLSFLWKGGPVPIAREAEKYRSEHPDWFHGYRSSKAFVVVEHFHPDLIACLKDALKIDDIAARRESSEKAPEGWKTVASCVRRYSRIKKIVIKKAEEYRASHPEWFQDYWVDSMKNEMEFYHPELIERLDVDFDYEGFSAKQVEATARKTSAELAPAGWKTPSALIGKWSLGPKIVQRAAEPHRNLHPEWFHYYWSDKTKDLVEYYHPDLITKLEESLKISSHILIINDAKLGKEGRQFPPPGWKTMVSLGHILSNGQTTIKNASDVHRVSKPEWFQSYWSTRIRKEIEYFHPDLIAQLKKDLKVNERIEKKATVEPSPMGWKTYHALSTEWSFSNRALIQDTANSYRIAHPEWFADYWSKKLQEATEYYHPDLIVQLKVDLKIKDILAERERASIERGDVAEAPTGWKTSGALVKSWRYKNTKLMYEKVDPYRKAHPEWFGSYWSRNLNKEVEYYHPDLIVRLEEDLNIQEHIRQKVAKKIERSLSKEAPAGWRTATSLAPDFHTSPGVLRGSAGVYRPACPEWFQNYWSSNAGEEVEYFHPDLVKRIEIDLRVQERKGQREGRIRQEVLEKRSVDFLREVAENITKDSQDFRKLLAVFGSSRCVDILFQFRPEYRVLKHEFVKGIISEYLGDCLTIQHGIPPDKKGLLLAIEQLSSPELQEGLYETMKDDCYYFLLNQQKTHPTKNRLEVTVEYKDYVRSRSGVMDHPIFNAIVDRVISYYTDLWQSYEKPTRFVDALKAGREFPDINQRINIKELEDKKRLVIADEMGVGKSASVIMAKEHLGLQCALIVVPSNVVETWKNYLSDNPDGGYFKEGQAPKVLVVQSPDQLAGINTVGYEYILVSHERLTDRYTEGLLEISYDMLIVDEYHKLKSLKGVRSEKLLQLAQKIDKKEPEDKAVNDEPEKYLALLSGTPVPNKVQDIAISLKLLYPERFGNTEDSQLVLQILKGDVLNLRSLLLPRLQMKNLRDAVEMPPLTEELIEIEAGELEKTIYQVFLEDDELGPTEKLTLLRQFTLSPWTTESTPSFKGSKIERVGEDARNAFETKKRVLLFVDDFVENVIRGEHTIMQEFNLPTDVVVRVVHGGVTDERTAIQSEFQNRTNPQKILLIVSGQTADVGVDYSAAEEVFHYNEPWTKYRKLQELGRANRPGLAQPLHARTYITKGTIEEGMHEYILQKYHAVEKLLRGIPLSQLEQQLLREDEKRDDSGLEVNAELAAYYFSHWDRMMQFFGHTKELGEENFRNFVETHGKEYARGYSELGVRSYQANANRVSGTVMHQMIRGGRQSLEEVKILDVASGPEMLRRHIDERYQNKITSVDINPYHFGEGGSERCVVGSWTALPFEARSFNYVNLSLAIDQASFIPSKGKTERIEVLKELNRVLKVGGKAVMSMIYSVDFKDDMGFRSALSKFGFRAVDEFCGEVSSGTRYNSRLVVLEKVDDIEIESEERVTGEDLLELLDAKEREGMKLVRKEVKIRDTRKVLTSFEINGRKEKIQLNALDRLVLAEEEDIVAQGENLKKLFTRIEVIPPKLIVENGFVRIKVGNKYVLFKKLTRAAGVVVIK